MWKNLYLFLSKTLNNFLSWVLNRYLAIKYPIFAVDSSQVTPIPSCAYTWPDGQGDTAKFLSGEKHRKDWARVLGVVYRIWSGLTPEIVLTTPEDVKVVFKDSDLHSKALNNDAGWLMGELLGQCLGLLTGDGWRKVHATVACNFRFSNASSSWPAISRLIDEHLASLAQQPRLMDGRLNLTSDLRLLPFWITAEYIYGPLNPTSRLELETLVPLVDSLFKRIIQGGWTRYAWSRYLPARTNRDIEKFKYQWGRLNDILYDRCVLENRNPPIVQIYQAMDKRIITREQGLQTLHEMLFANLDVTMGGLSWNLLFLASEPDVQAGIREEIRKAKAEMGDAAIGLERYIMCPGSLLAAAVLESARLKPAAAFSIPQAAPTDRVVGGFLVPAGINFIVDTHAINIENPYWGSDRGQYRPSRFQERKAWETRYNYWRFGFGPRQCVGKHLADVTIRGVIARLVEDYHLSMMYASTWQRNPDTWILESNTELQCEKINRS
ncbi:putative cytochrome P450 monooxygenase [Xylariaceae sp. FL0594]|nr:putative cytochrome P450 monooxygenase [Xylariaceae sp. FL0594]